MELSDKKSPEKKRSYHHGDLRTALIESALDIIAELGPRKLTIREVAFRAGVSHAAPYRHFKDKNELINAVVARGFELLQETMAQELSSAANDALAAFAASGRAYLAFGLNYPGYYGVMFSGDLLDPDGSQTLQHTSHAAFEQMKATLIDCQKLGILPKADPSLQAVWIVSTVHGYISLVNENRLNALVGNNHSMSEVQDYIVSAIFQGLGGSTPDVLPKK